MSAGGVSMLSDNRSRDDTGRELGIDRDRGRQTRSAAVTDSSQRSSKNSSRAIDSLSTLIMRWHSWGKKNSISSYGNCRNLLHRT